jgi:UTP:GlnB (protein PII) uridylyltransferase
VNNRRSFSASVAPPRESMELDPDSPTWGAGEHLVEDFIASMPKRYRKEFSLALARQHAHIAASRGSRPIYADLFSGGNLDGPGLCVVAPDSPGLLAVICTGLMLEDLDITRADAYTRRTSNGDYEAVDLFWVRRSPFERPAPLTESDLSAVQSALNELLRHGQVYRRAHATLLGISPGTSETSVRFCENYDVPWLTLELESNDRPGLLAVITNTLAAEGVQIVESRIRTHGLRVHDSFDIIESDGTCPTGTRLQRLQLAVFSAIDGPHHGA